MYSQRPSTCPRDTSHLCPPDGGITVRAPSFRSGTWAVEDHARARCDDRRVLTTRPWDVNRTICQYPGPQITSLSDLETNLKTQQNSLDELDALDFRRLIPKYASCTYALTYSVNPFHCFRFSNENFPKILDVVSRIKEIAENHKATPGQAALAWLLAQGDDFVAIPGTKKIKVDSFPCCG